MKLSPDANADLYPTDSHMLTHTADHHVSEHILCEVPCRSQSELRNSGNLASLTWRQTFPCRVAILQHRKSLDLVRVQPCILNSMLLQHISDASPKLFHILWCIVYQTPHVTQLCTAPCIPTSTCATSTCLFVCLPLSPVHVLLVLFVCFPFQIGSVNVNWWAVDQC